MKYNQLGRTGLFVSEICLGTMTFGGHNAFYQTFGKLGQAEVNALVTRALEAGVTSSIPLMSIPTAWPRVCWASR
jgi:aryl-alcohol dehydrogenase-like predicted oxidoreductase